MLKSATFGAAIIAVLATQITTVLAQPQPDIATLNAKLQQAVCTQKWGEAVKIVDQMIAITPSSKQMQHNELKTYRGRMQNLSVSKTNVDSWLESYCTAPVATSAVASNTTFGSGTITAQASDQSNCSSAYPDVCIPDPEPDLDCGEVPHSNFKVLPPDPHGFDGDGDGIGCEG